MPVTDIERSSRLALQTALLVPLVEWWLRRLGFRRCQQRLAWLARRLPGAARQPLSTPEAEALVRRVDYGNQHYSPYTARCLTRSLVAQYLLRRHGTPSELLLGARTLAGRFEAHAWLEHQGCALNETDPPRDIYAIFDPGDTSTLPLTP